MSEFGAIFSENLGNYVEKRISRIRFKLDPDFYLNLLQDFGEDEKEQQDQTKQAPAKNGKKPSFGQKTSIKDEGAQKLQDIWAIPALQARRQFLEQEAAKQYNSGRFKQIQKQTFAEEHFCKSFGRLEGIDSDKAFDLQQTSKISPGTRSLFQTMINQEKMHPNQETDDCFDMKAFFSKNYSLREKQAIAKTDLEPAGTEKVNAILNTINNYNTELGDALKHYEDINLEAQGCVKDSWMRFEQQKLNRRISNDEKGKDEIAQQIDGGIEEEIPMKTQQPNQLNYDSCAQDSGEDQFGFDFSRVGVQKSYIKPENVPRRAFSGEDRNESKSINELQKPKKTKDKGNLKLDMFF